MLLLRKRSEAVGAKVLHVTPPVFDPMPIKGRTLPAGLAEYRQPYEGYDDVLDSYSDWLLAQRANGWEVVDVHGPMQRFLAQERRAPGYRLANDGVHVNATGHWLIAREVLLHWGLPAPELAETTSGEQVLSTRPHGLDVLKLVQQKQRLLKDAWLTTTGHKRPRHEARGPPGAGRKRAGELDTEIRKSSRGHLEVGSSSSPPPPPPRGEGTPPSRGYGQSLSQIGPTHGLPGAHCIGCRWKKSQIRSLAEMSLVLFPRKGRAALDLARCDRPPR